MTTPEQALELFLPACVAAYVEDGYCPAGFHFVGNLVASSKAWGFVCCNPDTKITIVAFRGTDPHSAEEWLSDFTAIPMNMLWAPNVGLVHEGFADIYAGVRESLWSLMPKYEAGCKVYITGHSLGAALAVLAAYDFRQWEPEVVTFAGPRVGTHEFARNFNNANRQGCTRYVNHGDIVPDIPLEPIFHHVGTAITLRGGYDFENPAVAHSLTGAYTAGLKLLQVRQS